MWLHDDASSAVAFVLKFLVVAGVLAMGGIIVAHLGLVNRGAWEPDEYAIIAGLRDEGIVFMWRRFLASSPRPLSELLITLYGWAVITLKQPLIVPALLVLWTGFLASALPSFTGGVSAPRVLGSLAVLAFMLLGHGAFEVFYWPVGAVAYLPVLSAALFLLFALANENHRSKSLAGLVLVAAAWSAEAGAMLVLFFAGAMTVAAMLSRRPGPAARAYWVAPIVAAALAVLLVATNGRLLVATGLEHGDPALIHHWGPSVVQAAKLWAGEFVSADAATFDRPHVLAGLTIKLLFFAGIHLCWQTSSPRRDRDWLIPLALALLATGFATLVAGYWNNGTACCQRHNLLRQDFGFLALAALAIWLPSSISVSPRWAAGIAAVLLTTSAILAIAPRAHDMALDYRYWSEPGRARALTWASGTSPGPRMTLYQPVPDALFSLAMPPGTWREGDSWWIHGLLRFFGKETVRVSLAGSRVATGAEFPP